MRFPAIVVRKMIRFIVSLASRIAAAVSALYVAIIYLMACACPIHVRKNNEKGVQHEAIGYLREVVKKKPRIGIIRK